MHSPIKQHQQLQLQLQSAIGAADSANGFARYGLPSVVVDSNGNDSGHNLNVVGATATANTAATIVDNIADHHQHQLFYQHHHHQQQHQLNLQQHTPSPSPPPPPTSSTSSATTATAAAYQQFYQQQSQQLQFNSILFDASAAAAAAAAANVMLTDMTPASSAGGGQFYGGGGGGGQLPAMGIGNIGVLGGIGHLSGHHHQHHHHHHQGGGGVGGGGIGGGVGGVGGLGGGGGLSGGLTVGIHGGVMHGGGLGGGGGGGGHGGLGGAVLSHGLQKPSSVTAVVSVSTSTFLRCGFPQRKTSVSIVCLITTLKYLTVDRSDRFRQIGHETKAHAILRTVFVRHDKNVVHNDDSAPNAGFMEQLKSASGRFREERSAHKGHACVRASVVSTCSLSCLTLSV